MTSATRSVASEVKTTNRPSSLIAPAWESPLPPRSPVLSRLTRSIAPAEDRAWPDVAGAAAAHDEVRGAHSNSACNLLIATLTLSPSAPRVVAPAARLTSESWWLAGATQELTVVTVPPRAVGGRDRERLLALYFFSVSKGVPAGTLPSQRLRPEPPKSAAAVLGQVEAAGVVDAALDGFLDLDVRFDRVVVGLRAGDPGVGVGAVLVAVAETVEHVRRVREVRADFAVAAQGAVGDRGVGALDVEVGERGGMARAQAPRGTCVLAACSCQRRRDVRGLGGDERVAAVGGDAGDVARVVAGSLLVAAERDSARGPLASQRLAAQVDCRGSRRSRRRFSALGGLVGGEHHGPAPRRAGGVAGAACAPGLLTLPREEGDEVRASWRSCRGGRRRRATRRASLVLESGD